MCNQVCRNENYMQNLIFHGRSLNPRTAKKSAVISAIAESRIPGGTNNAQLSHRVAPRYTCFIPILTATLFLIEFSIVHCVGMPCVVFLLHHVLNVHVQSEKVTAACGQNLRQVW